MEEVQLEQAQSFKHCSWMANPSVESHQYWSILTLFLFSIMVIAA